MRIRKWTLPALLLAITWNSALASPGHLQVLSGVDDEGRATPLWQTMIRKRLPHADFRAVESIVKPLAAGEQAWATLIRSRAAGWEKEIPALAEIFRPLAAPDARIVLGNRGGDDAFTHDPHTIGFDLERLNAIYGDASKPENAARVDRFFRHEYTHLLQKAWLAEHPIPLDTPLDRALAEIWTEGMGNWYSLSESWRTENGRPAARTTETLRVLEPRFVTRLAAIACASPEQAERLSADLSRGRFDRKWGALPVALWLELEPEPATALHEFLLAGPDGIWSLAERHVTPAFRPVLREIRSAQAICRRQ